MLTLVKTKILLTEFVEEISLEEIRKIMGLFLMFFQESKTRMVISIVLSLYSPTQIPFSNTFLSLHPSNWATYTNCVGKHFILLAGGSRTS